MKNVVNLHWKCSLCKNCLNPLKEKLKKVTDVIIQRLLSVKIEIHYPQKSLQSNVSISKYFPRVLLLLF
jgi:hypothetical protein